MRLGLGARLALAFAVLAAITALVTAGVASASTNRRVKDDVDKFLEDRSEDIAEGRRRPEPPRSRNNGNNNSGNNNSENSGNGNSRDNSGTTDIGLGLGSGNNRPERPDAPERPAVAAAGDESVLRAVEADAVVQIFDRTGTVIANTANVPLPITDADMSFTSDPAPPLLRTEVIDGVEYRVITRHISGGGAVQVAQDISNTNALLGEIRSEVIYVGIGMSAIAGLVGWGIASGTTRPLRRLTRSVREVGETQDLGRSVSLNRRDEIGDLSKSFDELLHSLASSRDQQQQLVQDAAHELRTPLTSVRANIDFLQRATDVDPETRTEMLTSIRSEVGELSDLLAEVVELATESRDRATFEPVDLVTAAESALAQFELRSARPVQRDMESSPVHGDLTMLARAIGNLIGNADKYTPDAGAPIRVHVSGGTVVIADRGPGIPATDHQHIFERFWRADEARSASGSGLGLAIVKKVVDDHGGTVFVRDRSGGGSEIGFVLPTLDPALDGR
ncbi:MAG: HAMP domain-containing sensor histidine kinase [Actinomycetota bacterium]